jgi:hypothetical protein
MYCTASSCKKALDIAPFDAAEQPPQLGMPCTDRKKALKSLIAVAVTARWRTRRRNMFSERDSI